jgi:hypothetical protein
LTGLDDDSSEEDTELQRSVTIVIGSNGITKIAEKLELLSEKVVRGTEILQLREIFQTSAI